mgnify:CR=1 FL=1
MHKFHRIKFSKIANVKKEIEAREYSNREMVDIISGALEECENEYGEIDYNKHPNLAFLKRAHDQR